MKSGSGRLQRRRPESSGQAAAEFALLLPVIALLVLGLTDFGRVFAQYQALINAAREGARYCGLHDSLTTAQQADPNRTVATRIRVLAELAGHAMDGHGTLSVRPAASTATNGQWYYATDQQAVYQVVQSPPGTYAWQRRLTDVDPLQTNCAVPNPVTSPVTVQAAQTFQPLTPLIGQFFSSQPPPPCPLRADGTPRHASDPCILETAAMPYLPPSA